MTRITQTYSIFCFPLRGLKMKELSAIVQPRRESVRSNIITMLREGLIQEGSRFKLARPPLTWDLFQPFLSR